jgi:hypothetical protein
MISKHLTETEAALAYKTYGIHHLITIRHPIGIDCRDHRIIFCFYTDQYTISLANA